MEISRSSERFNFTLRSFVMILSPDSRTWRTEIVIVTVETGLYVLEFPVTLRFHFKRDQVSKTSQRFQRTADLSLTSSQV
jgi:hypothetical protein